MPEDCSYTSRRDQARERRGAVGMVTDWVVLKLSAASPVTASGRLTPSPAAPTGSPRSCSPRASARHGATTPRCAWSFWVHVAVRSTDPRNRGGQLAGPGKRNRVQQFDIDAEVTTEPVQRRAMHFRSSAWVCPNGQRWNPSRSRPLGLISAFGHASMRTPSQRTQKAR